MIEFRVLQDCARCRSSHKEDCSAVRRGGENYVKEQERVFKLAFRKSPDMDITIDCRWFTR